MSDRPPSPLIPTSESANVPVQTKSTPPVLLPLLKPNHISGFPRPQLTCLPVYLFKSKIPVYSSDIQQIKLLYISLDWEKPREKKIGNYVIMLNNCI